MSMVSTVPKRISAVSSVVSGVTIHFPPGIQFAGVATLSNLNAFLLKFKIEIK